MEKKAIISARDVEIQFSLRGRTLKAIRKCSLDLYEGETLAIVGESGSGQGACSPRPLWACWTSTARSPAAPSCMRAATWPSSPKRTGWAVRGKKISMVMQDPMTSLNPLKKIGKQIRRASSITRA